MTSRIEKLVRALVVAASFTSLASLAGCAIGQDVEEPSETTASQSEALTTARAATPAAPPVRRRPPSDALVSRPSEGTVCDVCAILGCACANSECYECGLHITASLPPAP